MERGQPVNPVQFCGIFAKVSGNQRADFRRSENLIHRFRHLNHLLKSRQPSGFTVGEKALGAGVIGLDDRRDPGGVLLLLNHLVRSRPSLPIREVFDVCEVVVIVGAVGSTVALWDLLRLVGGGGLGLVP